MNKIKIKLINYLVFVICWSNSELIRFCLQHGDGYFQRASCYNLMALRYHLLKMIENDRGAQSREN